MTELLARLRDALSEHYAIERQIGRGGMATVYLARDIRHGRKVALKVLHPELTTTIGTERFLREIRTTARLMHPHVLPMHDSGEAAGVPYYTMPYVDGESLRGRLTRERRLPVDDAVGIAVQVADALAYAHAHGVVHRDVKPENILFSDSSHVWVSDFGLARALHSAAHEDLTASGLAIGSPRYISPEQAAGEREVDGRSDLYSLACVTYEMLTGDPPFRSATLQGVIAQHIAQRAPLVTDMRRDVPGHVSAALAKAMAKDPAERFATASEFAQALDPRARTVLYKRAFAFPRVRGVVWMASAGVSLLLAAGIATKRMGYSLPGMRTEITDVPRLAVLYFDDLTADSSLGHIAGGLTEQLIYELSGVNAFRVVPRNAVRQYRGRSVSLDSVIAALDVTTIVEGSVLRSGDRLRVVARVIDARSETYADLISVERPLADLATLEKEVAQQVASALRRHIGREVRLREAGAGTTSRRARELFFKAQAARDAAEALAGRPHPQDLTAAISTLLRADSLLALAQAEDRRWLRPTIDRGWIAFQRAELMAGKARRDALQEGLRHADFAMRRVPNSPHALELRGTLRWHLVSDLSTGSDTQQARYAEKDLRAALDRDSSLAGAWATLSYVLLLKGSHAEATLAAKRALREDAYLTASLGILNRLFFSALLLGDYDEAAEWCTRGRLTSPDDWRFLVCELTLMRHNASLPPNPARAWQLVEELDRLDPPAKAKAAGRPYLPIYRRVVAATISARAGRRDVARQELARAIRATQGDSSLRLDLAYDEAYLRWILGEKTRAIELLRELLEARPAHRPFLTRDPLIRDLALAIEQLP